MLCPVRLVSCDLRDGQQAAIATRMTTEEMLPVLKPLDEFGFDALEVWGGATFDACIRFLGEDPWERLRIIKAHVKKTPLRMLLRGQNLLGYAPYPDDVVDHFVAAAARDGIDISSSLTASTMCAMCAALPKLPLKPGRRWKPIFSLRQVLSTRWNLS